ncbi:hypothetical protein GC105_07885 [Alkalibaculum sp. M08DMB]|uniref:Rhomboid family intramembrane serine protease n=1 Tax=Alkalibaculum sporogenes TaxID=2655001 RepID=A0A6A7K880_9FIRM|nr:hypothetical protein [Alkalibaculum sporogenes]MPW25709.1 hypothetical protein [Alkalibaculum sporogenes]
MKWLWKLERVFDKFAIRNLMMYIAAINLGVYLIEVLIMPGFRYYLYFDLSLFLQGEIWRIITFIFIPPASGIFAIIVLYFYYMIGSSLENEWGTSKFNIYYLFGMVATIIASILTSSPAIPIYINLSLFLAFAHYYPDYQILLFFIIPVKIKYLGYLNWFFYAVTIITGAFPEKVFALVSLLNFFLFFYKDFFGGMSQKRKVYNNRRNYNAQIREFKKRK